MDDFGADFCNGLAGSNAVYINLCRGFVGAMRKRFFGAFEGPVSVLGGKELVDEQCRTLWAAGLEGASLSGVRMVVVIGLVTAGIAFEVGFVGSEGAGITCFWITGILSFACLAISVASLELLASKGSSFAAVGFSTLGISFIGRKSSICVGERLFSVSVKSTGSATWVLLFSNPLSFGCLVIGDTFCLLGARSESCGAIDSGFGGCLSS